MLYILRLKLLWIGYCVYNPQLVESMDVELANTECLNYEVTVLGFWYLQNVLEPIPVEPRNECIFPLFTL